jgi:MFS family permease
MRPPAPLRATAFRSVWLAGLVSDAGDWLLLIALPVVVYDLTGSALGTSVAFLVELAPGIVLAPLAGWCADRWDRRRMLVAISLAQAACLLPLLAVHTRADLPLVYAVIVVEAALLAVFDPTKNALLPTLVARKDLVAANSLVGLEQNLARLVGGPIGGVLLAVGGLRLVTGADLLSYLAAAALINGVRVARRVEPHVPNAQHRRRSGSYLSIVVRNPRVRATVLVAFISQIAQGIFVVLFILFVASRLHGGPAEVGLLRGVQAIGAVAGGLALTALSRRWRPASLTAFAAITFGVIDLVLWNAPSLSAATWIYVVLFIAIGAPGIVLATGLISSLQSDSPSHEHGCVFSAYGLAGNTGQVLGMLAAGLLTARLGLMTMLNTQALIYLAAGAFAARQITKPRAMPAKTASTPAIANPHWPDHDRMRREADPVRASGP